MGPYYIVGLLLLDIAVTAANARSAVNRLTLCVLYVCVQWVNDTILNLLYNSEYLFDVEYDVNRAKHSANVTLITPGCRVLIADSFKRCAVIGQPLTGASTRRLMHLFRLL